MKEDYINKLSKEIHKHNVAVGWWSTNQCIFEKMQLISTEVSEATEGARKDLMDDKLPIYKMERVELVDALVRALDVGGRYGFKYTAMDEGFAHAFIGSDKSVGCNHLGINCHIIDLAKAIYISDDIEKLSVFYSELIWSILEVAKVRGYNLAQPLVDKLAFNKVRPDHKLENRNKANGKSF